MSLLGLQGCQQEPGVNADPGLVLTTSTTLPTTGATGTPTTVIGTTIGSTTTTYTGSGTTSTSTDPDLVDDYYLSPFFTDALQDVVGGNATGNLDAADWNEASDAYVTTAMSSLLSSGGRVTIWGDVDSIDLGSGQTVVLRYQAIASGYVDVSGTASAGSLMLAGSAMSTDLRLSGLSYLFVGVTTVTDDSGTETLKTVTIKPYGPSQAVGSETQLASVLYPIALRTESANQEASIFEGGVQSSEKFFTDADEIAAAVRGSTNLQNDMVLDDGDSVQGTIESGSFY